MDERTITTKWYPGDFMPEPDHSIRVRIDGERAYCLRCGDEVKWDRDGTMARPTLTHTTKAYAEFQDCYTPRLDDPL